MVLFPSGEGRGEGPDCSAESTLEEASVSRFEIPLLFETQLVQKSWFGHEDVAVTRGGFIGGVKRGLAELRANDLNRDGFVTSDEVKTRRRTEVLTDKSQALVGLCKVL
jgi:hypothetical protein